MSEPRMEINKILQPKRVYPQAWHKKHNIAKKCLPSFNGGTAKSRHEISNQNTMKQTLKINICSRHKISHGS